MLKLKKYKLPKNNLNYKVTKMRATFNEAHNPTIPVQS